MRKDYSGPRTLLESILAPEVEQACREWTQGVGGGIIIGSSRGGAIDLSAFHLESTGLARYDLIAAGAK